MSKVSIVSNFFLFSRIVFIISNKMYFISLHYRKKQIYCRNGKSLSKYLDLEISYQISCISNELEMIDSICEETDNTFDCYRHQPRVPGCPVSSLHPHNIWLLTIKLKMTWENYNYFQPAAELAKIILPPSVSYNLYSVSVTDNCQP